MGDCWCYICLFPRQASTQLMLQCCGNIVTILVPMLPQRLSPTLWPCSFVDASKNPSNIVWTSNQHCVNVVPMLYFNQTPNIATMLYEHWPLSANVGTMFRQYYVNIVPMLYLHQKHNIVWTFSNISHCSQCSGSIVWTLYQCWCTALYLVVLGPEW